MNFKRIVWTILVFVGCFSTATLLLDSYVSTGRAVATISAACSVLWIGILGVKGGSAFLYHGLNFAIAAVAQAFVPPVFSGMHSLGAAIGVAIVLWIILVIAATIAWALGAAVRWLYTRLRQRA